LKRPAATSGRISAAHIHGYGPPRGEGRGMFQAIPRGFMKLAAFRGRDTRSQFWPYAIVAVFVAMLPSAFFILPEFTGAFARMQQFAVEHPELTTVQATPNSYSIQIQGHHPELMPDISVVIRVAATAAGLAVILLAAAVARRLHDANRTALWGLLPLPFIGVAITFFPRLFTAALSDPSSFPIGLFFALFLNNLLYLASLGLLGVMLAGQSTDGPNRFGMRH